MGSVTGTISNASPFTLVYSFSEKFLEAKSKTIDHKVHA